MRVGSVLLTVSQSGRFLLRAERRRVCVSAGGSDVATSLYGGTGADALEVEGAA